jgi:hypothetical protein
MDGGIGPTRRKMTKIKTTREIRTIPRSIHKKRRQNGKLEDGRNDIRLILMTPDGGDEQARISHP